MAVSTLAALATTGTQWAVTASFGLAMAVKTFAISFALSAVSRALAPKPQIDTATGLSSTVKSPTQPRPILYGRTKTAGTLIYVQTTGDDGKYLHMVQAMAGHEIDAYEEIYIDDKLAWKLGTVQPWFQAKTRFRLYTGNQTTADPDLVAESNEWTDTCILNDTAYIYLRLEHDSEVFNNGIPNVTAVVRGKKVYNPVTDVTEWTQNPALCIADYINDSKYGLSGIEIDQTSLANSISVCEQQVDYTDENSQSSTHERYKLDGYIDTSDKISSNIENMLSSMFGELVYSQGKLHINAGYYTEPTLDLDESMMVGDITLQTKQSRRAQYNAVKGVFLSKEENYVLADYPSQISDDYALIDGDPIYLDMTLPFTTDNVRAQRLAKLALGKSRQQRVITVPVNLVGLKIKAGDNIRITNEKLGLDNAVYQVVDYELEFSEQLKVNLVCVETGASLYDWALADQQDFSSGSDVELYDGSAQAPTNLNLTAGTNIKSDGTTATYIDASWTAPADVYFDYFEVTITPSGGSANSFTTKESTHRFLNTDDDLLHSISVRSYNTLGRKSDAITAGVTTGIDEEAPAEPTGFNVTGELNQISLSWVNPSDDDFDKVRIKSSTQNDESASIVIAELKGDGYIDSGYTGVITKHYWMQAVDRTGNASDYVYAGTGTTTRLTSDDFSDDVITLDFVDTAFSNKLAEIDLKAPQSQVTDIVNTAQRADDTLNLVSTRMLTLATRQDEFTGLMRDAGITVDPENGTITLQAVESLRSETESSLNQVGIKLDAQSASISLKASTDYVNNAIASAVLDSADLASLNELELKVSEAEVDIDALEGQILLKTDTVEFNGLDLRVGQAEIDINSNEAAILLKADNSEFLDLSERVGTAEIQINAIDAPSITQTVVDTRKNTQALDKTAIQNLKDVIGQYRNREKSITDLAFARQQIFADVNEQREATATARLELGSLIEENQASIISESQTRATEDSALSSRIDVLTATTGNNTSSITDINFVSVDSDSAIARTVSQLTTTVGINSGLVNDAINLATTAQDTADGKVTTFYQDDAPTADGSGDLWIDTNDKNKLYRWSGSTWVQVQDEEIQDALASASNAQDTADGKIVSFYQDDKPTTGTLGDLWIDTNDNNTLYRHNGTDFINVRDIGIGEAITRANTAQSTADGKVTTFYQDAEPTGDLGDLWIDTNDGNKLYRYSTVTIEVDGDDVQVDRWEEVQDTAIQQAISDASNAQSTADGKIVSFYQDDEPSTASVGDLWIDTNDGNKLYVYSGTIWNSAQDAQIVTATTTLTEQAETINGIKGQYAISINNNGSVSGFGLISELIDDEVVSAFAVSADQFYLTGDVDGSIWDNTITYQIGDLVIYFGRTYEAKTVNSNKVPSTNPSDWDDITSIPFAVYTADTQVTKNGETTTIPAGVYIQDAYIQNLSVGTDTIQGSAVTTDKIENLAITTAKIGDAQITTAKIGDAQITNAKINDLSADKITAGTINTSRLNIDGVTLDTNASGQLVISNEGVDTAQIAGDAVTVPTYIEGIQVSTSGTTAWTTLIDQTVDYGISVNAFISFVVTARRYIDGNSAFDTYSIRMKMYDNGTLVKQIDLNDLEGDSPTAINSFNSVPIMGGAFINSGNMRIVLEGRSENVATSKYYMKAQGFSYNAKR